MKEDNISQDSTGKRVQLRVLGISYSQIQSGAYALILAEVRGPVRLPVVVGAMEAQSIAIRLENITPPRPMTHDLFSNLMASYGLHLLEVFIYKFEDGIFSSAMTFMDENGKTVTLDARTSDAIAIAMRENAPIFTTPQIIRETGFTMETVNDEESTANRPENESEGSHEEKTSRLRKLQNDMQKAIEAEEYEKAQSINREITDLQKEIEENDKGTTDL